MLALAFLLPVAVGWGIYEIFSLEDDNSKSANDEYIGTEDPNNFDGRAGNDTLNGLEGKDTLDGGYGMTSSMVEKEVTFFWVVQATTS